MTTDEKRRCTAMGALAREKDTARCRLGAREVYGAQAAASSLSSAPVSEHRLHEAEGRPGNIDCMRPKVADQGGVGLRREEHHATGRNGKACADEGTNLRQSHSPQAHVARLLLSRRRGTVTTVQHKHARLFVAGKSHGVKAAAASMHGT